MKVVKFKYSYKPRTESGDTIIEVLIAVAVAAFAIGISYAVANKSLQRAVMSRERNEAVNIIQNQLATLKQRFKTDTSFKNTLSVPASFTGTGTARHFCLDNNGNNFSNGFGNDAEMDTLTVDSSHYAAACKITTSTTDYYVDIAAMVTDASKNSKNRTIYRLSARWNEVGGGINRSIMYYRLPENGGVVFFPNLGLNNTNGYSRNRVV